MPSLSRGRTVLITLLFGIAALMLASPAVAACPCSLFSPVSQPGVAGAPTQDGRYGEGPFTLELGVKFTVDTPASVTAVRFYKDPGETGAHQARIWTEKGYLMAQAGFQSETSSGWQRQALPSQIMLQPGSVYVISVNANSAYGLTPFGLLSAVTSGPLRSIADGANGVYAMNAGLFPDLSHYFSNYFVDLEVMPSDPPPTTVAVRINVGGHETGAFAEDGNYSGGQSYASSRTIAGASDQTLYQDERWGQFAYSIPVPNGSYDVRLHFAELYYGTVVPGSCVGKRIFGMDVLDTAGTDIAPSLDICAQVGPNAALVKTIPGVVVKDGRLDLESVYGPADDPELVGIEILPAGSAPPPPPPPPPTGTTTVRINTAGGSFTTAGNATYEPDRYFSGGSIYSTNVLIAGTFDDALYQTERWGQFDYAIDVANGRYDVRLHFVELYYGTVVPGSCVGKRLFGVDVLDTAGTDIPKTFDICAQVGARAALVKTIKGVTVSDGQLNVHMLYGAADDPELAAIEVVPAS
jgi:uncharacterized protein DUF4082/malectin (di-glucose binding ER protein)